MNRTQIGLLITQTVEDYVRALDSSDIEQMQAEYETAARSMFEWLRAYRCDAKAIGKACSIIQALTGLHPSQVRSSTDAQALRTALLGARNSQLLGERISVNDLIDPASWAVENVRFGHGGDTDPIDRQH